MEYLYFSFYLDIELWDFYYFLKFYVEELKLAIFASQIAKRKVKDHPIDFSQFKPSLKRVEAAIEEEEKRIGIS